MYRRWQNKSERRLHGTCIVLRTVHFLVMECELQQRNKWSLHIPKTPEEGSKSGPPVTVLSLNAGKLNGHQDVYKTLLMIAIWERYAVLRILLWRPLVCIEASITQGCPNSVAVSNRTIWAVLRLPISISVDYVCEVRGFRSGDCKCDSTVGRDTVYSGRCFVAFQRTVLPLCQE